MNKRIPGLLFAGILVFGLILPAHAGGRKDAGNAKLKVGATPVPHAELLNLIREDLAAQGIDLEVVEFTDYVTPNTALIAGDIDANFFQHVPYLASNAEWSNLLVSAFGVHVEPFGLYSSSVANIAAIKEGAVIAIPNDPSNGGRALLLLQAAGLLTLKAGTGITATPLDIAVNPRKLQFRELEAAQLPRSLADVDAAAINGNYALEAGLNPAKDALIIEGAESPYVNIVVVKKGAETDSRIQALGAALRSAKVKEYINKTWSDGSVVAIF
ncbi:MAG: MetQ/NlpA family ABC transporter substrate-binding protein [Treponema sp.]|jgi:D-methionine transport system substrate-binding protein|nr:MetQ/NlpA family ABC transporter substrate-binding protein [Treponema sp.]